MRSIFLLVGLFISASSHAQENDTTFQNTIELSERLFDEKLYDSSYAIINKVLAEINVERDDSLVTAALIQKLKASSEVNPSIVDSLYKATVQKSQAAQHWELLAKTHFTRGRIYYRAKDYGNAQSYFFKVDSIATQQNILNETVIRAILARSEISRTTFTYEGVEKASDLQVEALALAQQLESEELIYNIYTRLADMNGLKGNLPEVRKYLDLAFPYFFAKNDVVQLHRLFFTEKSYYYDLENFTKAEETVKKSIDYFLKEDAQEELASSYVSYGNFFRKKRNDCVRAIPEFKKAQAIYEKLDQKLSDRYMYLVEGMALCEAANGNYKEAYEYYQETYLTKKQLVKDANNNLTRQLETKYQTEKKQQEITLLKSQKELAEQQKKNQRNIMLGGLGLTSLAGIFLFIGFRNRKKVNDKLRELDATKSNFFANISHEFRTPLALIAGPIETQLQKEDLSLQEKQHLKTAQRNSKRLLALVDQLLDLSKLESGHFKIKIQQGDLGLFIKSIASLFEYQATEKNQTYETQVLIPNESYYFDADALEKIITNLLANAIKYSPEKANIQLQATIENGTLNLDIKNSGVSLPQNVIDTLFNRFERADETVTGSGIGLALTKELVEIHKGTITVVNENDWMHFSITLPVKAAAYSQDELSEGQIAITKYEKVNPAFAKAETQTPIIDDEKDIFYKDTNPILLIVDDNEDLREYVSSLFKDEYAIHTAENGKKGFDIAQEVIPDLVVTDLMMPEEDGLIFTKNCKSAEATSHIPIIMLTAKASDENLLEGLETGADAYLTKPFSTEVLKSTVHNLLENRKNLQERFSQEVVLLPKDVATTSIEEKFLDNLKIVLEEKLIESDFNTEDFAKALGMSRMQLHRKLKALTGLSATEFVRSQRLKLAAQMLKKSDINVSQVGYAVGFNNHSYFTKCFKEQYGVSPSEYAKRS